MPSADQEDVRLARGVLVVFEGIDGAGKTTQARLLERRLRDAGIAVTISKEPTGGQHGRVLRASAASGRLEPERELALFEADRREHVEEVIAPALSRGEVVIVDRYYFSTAAYQGARGMDPDEILTRNESFAPQPDLLVLLTISVGEALERIEKRGDGAGNEFEREPALRKCAAIFGQIDRPYLARIDGTESVDAIHADLVSRLLEGPLFRAACHKDYLQACEPVACSYRIQHQCDYPTMTTRLVGRSTGAFDEVQRIAEDPDLSPAEKLGRTAAILRSYPR